MSADKTSKFEFLLQQAALGSQTHIRELFQILPDVRIFAIERFQEKKLSDAPEYPNEFFNILAVKSNSLAAVPVFTNPSQIQEWCGLDLSYRELLFSDLLELIPENWHIVINPAQEVEKELTAWEIEKLRAPTEDTLAELVDDNIAHFQDTPVELQELSGEDFSNLKIKLIEYASLLANNSTQKITKLYLLKSILEDVDTASNEIFLTAFIDNEDSYAKIQSDLSAICRLELMGNFEFKVRVCGLSNQLQLKLLERFQPIWENKRERPNLLTKIKNFLHKS